MRISKWGFLGLESDGIRGACRIWLKGYHLGKVGVGNGNERKIGVGVMKFFGWVVCYCVCSLISMRFGCIPNVHETSKD